MRWNNLLRLDKEKYATSYNKHQIYEHQASLFLINIVWLESSENLTKTSPPFSVAVGVPAKFIKNRKEISHV